MRSHSILNTALLALLAGVCACVVACGAESKADRNLSAESSKADASGDRGAPSPDDDLAEGEVVWEYITPDRRPSDERHVAEGFSLTPLLKKAPPRWIDSGKVTESTSRETKFLQRVYSAEFSMDKEESPEPKAAPEEAGGMPDGTGKTPVGRVDTRDGAWVLSFDDLPGKDEKPKTKVRTVTGKVDVYEIYDWAEHHEEMRGQTGHVWYRVEPDEGHWVYGSPGFDFSSTDETSD